MIKQTQTRSEKPSLATLIMTLKSNDKDTPQFYALYHKGIKLRRQKELQKALKVFSRMANRWPDHPAPIGMIGVIYRELGHFQESLKYFEKAVQLSPGNELASLCLYHTLIDVGNKKGAYTEMRRFLAGATDEPLEYKLLLDDLAKALGMASVTTENYPEIVDKIMEELNRLDQTP